jgi:hypothetical protein
MIGRVGRDRCTQLRGKLHSQRAKLQEAESKKYRDEIDILKIKAAIENTKRELKEQGCDE